MVQFVVGLFLFIGMSLDLQCLFLAHPLPRLAMPLFPFFLSPPSLVKRFFHVSRLESLLLVTPKTCPSWLIPFYKFASSSNNSRMVFSPVSNCTLASYTAFRNSLPPLLYMQANFWVILILMFRLLPWDTYSIKRLFSLFSSRLPPFPHWWCCFGHHDL